MDRNLLLASAAITLVGTVGIVALFSQSTSTAGNELPEPAALEARPGEHNPPRRPASMVGEVRRPRGPFREDPQDVVGDKPGQSTVEGETRYGPSHEELRERVLDPDEIERRERAREEHQERIAETTKKRFVEFALQHGVDREETNAAAQRLDDYLHNSRSVRDAVRTGDLTRDEAKAELQRMKLQMEDDLLDLLGEEDYTELRRAVPGKW